MIISNHNKIVAPFFKIKQTIYFYILNKRKFLLFKYKKSTTVCINKKVIHINMVIILINGMSILVKKVNK